MGRFCISQISNINKQAKKTLVSPEKIKFAVFKLVFASFPLRFWFSAVEYVLLRDMYWNIGKLVEK